VNPFLPAFVPDSRGNRLKSYDIRRRPEPHTERRIYLCGPSGVEKQIRWLVDYRGLSARTLDLRPEDKGKWSHRVAASGPIPRDIRATLELLTEVVTLPERKHLDIALTLDFYKDPDPDLDPYSWPNTETGDLVHRGKYHASPAARNELAQKLARVARTHPFYVLADYVAPVPGHDSSKASFGAGLAGAVAAELGKPLVEVSCKRKNRPEAKDRPPDGLEDEFTIANDVDGDVVLIVDDVWRTGDSMSGVAAAARRAGARAVVGLTGVRTMRGRG
jgi:hypothetical protein